MFHQLFQCGGCLALFIVCALSFSGAAAAEEVFMRHQSFEDFSKGSFGDSGANIYVSSSGTIQLIPLWDLNGDGHLDLLINQDHNLVENVDAFIHWGTSEGYHSLFPPFWRELPRFKLVRALGPQPEAHHVSADLWRRSG